MSRIVSKGLAEHYFIEATKQFVTKAMQENLVFLNLAAISMIKAAIVA